MCYSCGCKRSQNFLLLNYVLEFGVGKKKTAAENFNYNFTMYIFLLFEESVSSTYLFKIFFQGEFSMSFLCRTLESMAFSKQFMSSVNIYLEPALFSIKVEVQ